MHRRTRAGICALMGLVASQLAMAGDFVWTGGGDGTNWITAANWDAGIGYPDGGDDRAFFTNGAAAVTVPAGLTLGALALGTNYLGTNSLAGNLILVDTGGQAGSLTVDGGLLRTGRDVVSGIAANGTIRIGAGGTIVVRRASTVGEGQGQTLSAAAMRIDGWMQADGEGFLAPAGPAPGGGFLSPGGSHGGRGGFNGKATYGSFANPISLGSAGSSPNAGGGAIVLTIGGTLTVDGTLSADGLTTPGTYGGGAGGSINLAAALLDGGGAIRANGGLSTLRHGGGGGRISLVNVAAISFTGTLQAHGGNGVSTYSRGFAGTIAFPQDHHLHLGGAGRMQSLRLGTDGSHDYAFGSIVLEEGGTLEIDGNPLENNYYGGAAVIAADSVDVKMGGLFTANGLGFYISLAAGEPRRTISTAGAYGGAGGNNLLTYGSITNPVNMGSGASTGGGGCLMLRVAGTLNVDGTVAADSLPVNNYNGASGGSVNIVANRLTGGGVVTANSGAATRNGGGGGRIAVAAPESTFTGTVTAVGGNGSASYNGHGAAGTIFTDLNGRRRLLVDNDKVHEAKPTYTWLPAVEHAPAAPELDDVLLVVTNYGRVALTNNVTVGNLYLEGAIPSLFLQGWTLTVNSPRHGDWGGDSLVNYAGGSIIWKRPGTVFMIR